MILRFGFRNFLSFDEGVECSFVSDAKNKVNTLLNIRGANGAGKTNLLKALAFFMDFVANSFNLKPDAPTGVVSFFNSPQATDFFIEFKTANASDKYTYLYELSLTKDAVVSEKITRTLRRSVEIITRKGTNIKTISEFDSLKNIKKIRNNASLISCANQNEIEELKDIYSVFSRVLTNIDSAGMTLPFNLAEDYGKSGLSKFSQFYYEQPQLFSAIKKIIAECDIGIYNIEIQKEQGVSGDEVFYPVFFHKNNGKSFSLPYSAESRGTQFLYINLRLFWLASQKAHTLLIFDELDLSLHTLLVKKIISMFEQDGKDAHSCGQMIFTAHDTGIMDSLKADRSFLLNKEDNESFGYRVDECPSAIVRKDRSIRTPYELGRIGGVPKL